MAGKSDNGGKKLKYFTTLEDMGEMNIGIQLSFIALTRHISFLPPLQEDVAFKSGRRGFFYFDMTDQLYLDADGHGIKLVGLLWWPGQHQFCYSHQPVFQVTALGKDTEVSFAKMNS
ncbi:hypothetical protein E5D57_003536 [Metarhizium anisopliae]|nr:hypothetical protein E5D57_003536 [Metarhizium anisopliae]